MECGIQPRWKIPEYTKKEINNAGNIIRNENASEEDKARAKVIIDNWRAAHAYPLHVFYINLRRKAGTYPDIIVAERLKRLDSIIDKLKREPRMELYRMQDLGGCRMILPTLEDVYKFSNELKNSKIRHEAKNTKDYIMKPKVSGYRSLHCVYKFQTDSKEKEIYNTYPMLIEIQFRTHLQHIWATAVESIGLFTNQALKSGRGDEDIKRFFVLVSSLFAIREGTPQVPNALDKEEVLLAEIKELDKKRHLLEMLRAIRLVVEDGSKSENKGYFILKLDYSTHRLSTLHFKPSEFERASVFYDTIENAKREKEDIVLVRASSFTMVKEAYPNYFLDIGEFVDIVSGYLR